MPLLRSSLVSSNDNSASDISTVPEMTFSNEIVPSEKSSTSLAEKNGYRDSIYLNAANIFQGIHNEKPQDKILVKYGNGPLPSLPDFKDEHFQRLSYELAFSALKCCENLLPFPKYEEQAWKLHTKNHIIMCHNTG
ncbi:hypothetical protein JD844_027213 [Phrynosoma platyrhinos]|uniref:Uncharacterized protein n=1 Tax=Phrynosoma platyrhinos TaxID=52577 RepID=A0ABQ7SFW1_PHRPL|nr:hypothetical protein JD844_027213 [Phrynosoma platyrhinos]